MSIETAANLDERRKLFGEWFQDRRQRSGYPSAKEFAHLIGITPVQLSRIETGVSGISAETLNRAIDLLSLDLLDAYKRAGLLPALKIRTVEEALDVISFFDQQGISEADRASLRPLLQSADIMIRLLRRTKEVTDEEVSQGALSDKLRIRELPHKEEGQDN